MVSRNYREAKLQEVGMTQIWGDHDFLIFYEQDKFQCIFYNRVQDIVRDRQTPPSSYLKLVEFETYYIQPNPPLFFPPTKYAMVLQHGPFSLPTMLEGP